MPTAKAIFLLCGVFENVQSKLKNVHKYMSGIDKICCGKMGLEKNKCMIFNKEDIVKFYPLKTRFNLKFFEILKNMVCIIENHNIIFWIIILIAV